MQPEQPNFASNAFSGRSPASVVGDHVQLRFHQVAPQGFGDRHNSWAWSMFWWRDRLYVGTNRSWQCAEAAGIKSAFSVLGKYPPADPHVACTPDPADLPLQAEIWRWSPDTDHWDRVYQAPRTIPVPNRPGKSVAPDIGYRYMVAFDEPDGTEALYVAGVSPRFIFRPFPAPRLLRSIDGTTFAPVPQEPGSFLASLTDKSTLRTLVSYKDRLFVTTGSVRGEGILLEAHNPAAGNNAFRQVSPGGMSIFEMCTFNGYLYVGLRDARNGYAVLKTEASGEPPYRFVVVVPPGAFLTKPSLSVISMHVFHNQLYVGTDRPAEIVRINPDDSWELVIGTPRETPNGWIRPISGLDAGFGSWFNAHIWRMQDYNGRLYLGTANLSSYLHTLPESESILQPNYGFDLFETEDGCHFRPITQNGFGDRFNMGLRSFASTPYGLFLGTANSWYGLQVWQGLPAERDVSVVSSAGTTGVIEPAPASPSANGRVPAPEYLAIDYDGDNAVLSWDMPATVRLVQVWRARITNERKTVETHPLLSRILRVVRLVVRRIMPDLYLPPLPDLLWVYRPYELIGSSETGYFVDTTAQAQQRYIYYVQAENGHGQRSAASNIVAVPLIGHAVTFERVLAMLDSLATTTAGQAVAAIRTDVQYIARIIHTNADRDITQVWERLWQHMKATDMQSLVPHQRSALEVQLRILQRRIALAQAGVIAQAALFATVGD